ncbi:hypothetical protein BDR03DRAFT_1017658 [Suillus americanus]|nr:hypothetical protein BDR03DRAFT_1017658 [Suillus americanus]
MLLHPVFRQFIDDSRTQTITEEDNRLVGKLANVMSALYGAENERVDAVSKVLAGYGLGFLVKCKVKGTVYETDTEMSVDVHNNRHPFMISEFKNEAATSSSEPYMQALAYYLESMRGFASKMSRFALPCFLLIIFGPYLVFAGAVWTLHPAAQILSSPLAFNYHCTDTDSHMAAFWKSVRVLERYYEMLPPESKLANKLRHLILFPYPKSFKCLDDSSETQFKYTGQLEEEDGMSKRLGNQKLQIACGHPRELDETIPTMLLHPVFRQFIDDSRTQTITEEDNRLVGKLANVMSALYGAENERVDAVSKVLAGYGLGFLVKCKVKGTVYETDTEMSVDVHNNRHPFMISEFKNEAATSSSEPYMQALAYYLESTRGFASKMSRSALPCFLLIIFGPYLVFAGAVWTLHPAAQILSSPLAFNYHCTDTDSHMAAFWKSVRALERYYEMLPPESKLANKLRHLILFPYPKSFKCLDDSSETQFKYTGQLEEEDGMSKRLVFFGTLSDGRAEAGICIKFIRHYSRDAHLHCALSGVTPRLYDVLADLPDTERLPRLVFEDIGEQLKTLHACQLVHRDIHDTNIMVKKDDRMKFMIIDFNWVGVEEATRYPPYVNYSKIKRPEEARDGLPVKAAHDDVMLDVIIEMRAMREMY